jgi:hypothetical protein
MKVTDSLKEIERRAYRSTFEDGIYDILFGMLFLILALIPVLGAFGIPVWCGYLFGIIPAVFAWFGKRHITIPRLGAVEFGKRRRSRRLLFLMICAGFFFLTLPLLLMISAKGFGGGLAENSGIPLAVGMVVAPLVIVAAYFLDYPRMYIYAAVLFFGIPHAKFLYPYLGKPFNSLITFGIPAAAILVFGLTLLSRFVRKYPKTIQEGVNVSQ